MCAFGAPYRKNTKFGLVNSEHLTPLAQRCPGFHRHIQLTGSLCTAASEYPSGLTDAWAELS
eukprot:14088323-Heterocapsa_arctica.AAC.1